MRLKIMIARYCVFLHVYFYSILRLDGIHSVTGAEKILLGLHSKSQLFKILDVEKTRNGVPALQLLHHTHIRMKQKRTHANVLCSYIGTKYVTFEAYMYKKKQKPEYTLKYYDYFCALPKGCNAQRVFYSYAMRCPTPSGLKSVCSKLLPKNCWHHQLVTLKLQHKIMRVISKTTRNTSCTQLKNSSSQQYYHHNMIMC